MRPNHVGIALIIANTKYPSRPRSRDGVNNDIANMQQVFQTLNYRDEVHEDKTKSEIDDLFAEIAKQDHSQHDSFACCISSKGYDNNFITVNQNKQQHYIDVYTLVEKIQSCPTLQGKPKLFFLACNRIKSKRQFSPKKHKLADHTLIVWACQKEKEQLFSNTGSIFFKRLRQFIELKSSEVDLLTLLFEVSASICLIPPTHSSISGRKEIHCCEIESSLSSTVRYKIKGKNDII